MLKQFILIMLIFPIVSCGYIGVGPEKDSYCDITVYGMTVAKVQKQDVESVDRSDLENLAKSLVIIGMRKENFFSLQNKRIRALGERGYSVLASTDPVCCFVTKENFSFFAYDIRIDKENESSEGWLLHPKNINICVTGKTLTILPAIKICPSFFIILYRECYLKCDFVFPDSMFAADNANSGEAQTESLEGEKKTLKSQLQEKRILDLLLFFTDVECLKGALRELELEYDVEGNNGVINEDFESFVEIVTEIQALTKDKSELELAQQKLEPVLTSASALDLELLERYRTNVSELKDIQQKLDEKNEELALIDLKSYAEIIEMQFLERDKSELELAQQKLESVLDEELRIKYIKHSINRSELLQIEKKLDEKNKELSLMIKNPIIPIQIIMFDIYSILHGRLDKHLKSLNNLGILKQEQNQYQIKIKSGHATINLNAPLLAKQIPKPNNNLNPPFEYNISQISLIILSIYCMVSFIYPSILLISHFNTLSIVYSLFIMYAIKILLKTYVINNKFYYIIIFFCSIFMHYIYYFSAYTLPIKIIAIMKNYNYIVRLLLSIIILCGATHFIGYLMILNGLYLITLRSIHSINIVIMIILQIMIYIIHPNLLLLLIISNSIKRIIIYNFNPKIYYLIQRITYNKEFINQDRKQELKKLGIQKMLFIILATDFCCSVALLHILLYPFIPLMLFKIFLAFILVFYIQMCVEINLDMIYDLNNDNNYCHYFIFSRILQPKRR